MTRYPGPGLDVPTSRNVLLERFHYCGVESVAGRPGGYPRPDAVAVLHATAVPSVLCLDPRPFPDPGRVDGPDARLHPPV